MSREIYPWEAVRNAPAPQPPAPKPAPISAESFLADPMDEWSDEDEA